MNIFNFPPSEFIIFINYIYVYNKPKIIIIKKTNNCSKKMIQRSELIDLISFQGFTQEESLLDKLSKQIQFPSPQFPSLSTQFSNTPIYRPSTFHHHQQHTHQYTINQHPFIPSIQENSTDLFSTRNQYLTQQFVISKNIQHRTLQHEIGFRKIKGIRKNGLKRQQKKKGYSTKNLLPNFKCSHFDFILSYFGVINNQDACKIYKKIGISLQDYQTLYKIPEYREGWEVYFNSRQIYRDLMTSKMSGETRKVSLRFIGVFERWFKQGFCDKIHI